MSDVIDVLYDFDHRRDLFVVRSVKRGMPLEEVFEKIGLVKSSYDDVWKKYGRLRARRCNS